MTDSIYYESKLKIGTEAKISLELGNAMIGFKSFTRVVELQPKAPLFGSKNSITEAQTF
jgi:hypothetical protein